MDDLLHPDFIPKIEQHLNKLGFSQYTIDVKEGSKRGDNYLGVIAKIVVMGKNKDGETATLNWLAKRAPTQRNFRDVCNIAQCYARELYMYLNVFPEFLKLQEENDVKEPFKNFAPVHVSCLEEGKECFVMDDMKERGFRLGDRFKPLDLEHVMLAMRVYGKYHALSFAMREQKPELFRKLTEGTKDHFFFNPNHKELDESFKKALNKAIGALDPECDGDIVKKLEELKPKVFEVFRGVLHPDAAGEYSVIGHGDCWVNNMLFKYGPSMNPEELLLLDFQLSRIGSPCLDLSYFLFTATDKALRDEHFDDILDEYHRSLTNFLLEFKVDPETCYPKKIFEEQMKRFSVFGMTMALMILQSMVMDSEDIPDVANMSSEEMIKFQHSSKNIHVYNERAKGVMLDCVARGYF